MTEVDINLLFSICEDCFNHITDENINECLVKGLTYNPDIIYKMDYNCFSFKNDKTYDTCFVATIVKEIMNGTYRQDFHIEVWDMSDNDEPNYEIDDHLFHVKAFHYCKKNMNVMIFRHG